MVVVLDTGPLGLIVHPGAKPLVVRCKQWLVSLEAAGHRVVVPEIADYELRRELLLLGSHRALADLDVLGAIRLDYLPLTTPVMQLAAGLWATARRTGQPTATNAALDGDMILAAQTLALADPTAVIATGNPGHLTRFAPAADWQTIVP